MNFVPAQYRSRLADALTALRRRQTVAGARSASLAGNGTVISSRQGRAAVTVARQGRGRPPVYGTGMLLSGVSRLWTTSDEDWWRRRVGAGNVGQRMGGRDPFSSGSVGANGVMALRHELRSAFGQNLNGRIATRLVLAAGGQAAVVKVASFGGGGARVGALMRYQSQGGSLALERQDGSLVTGVHAISDVAREWTADGHVRTPTKDVLRLSMTVGEGEAIDPDDIDIEGRLSAALPGHRFAFRAEALETGGVRVEVVMSAAARPVRGARKGERYFDNRKSLERLEQALDIAFGRDTVVDIKGFAHGVEGVARYLGQLTRMGSLEAHSVRMEGRKARIAGFTQLNGHEDNLAEARRWERDLRSQVKRDAMHVILSSKPGTDGAAFLDAARSMLARTFGDHDYVFVMHRDRGHLHVHAAVRVQSPSGKRLDPKITDFRRWRETLAEEAQARGIAMVATHNRFEQAHHPSYRLSDIQRYQRGVATPAIQRRVEAVKNRDIYVPVRPEGKQAANNAAVEWRRAETFVNVLPAHSMSVVPPAAVINYRNRAALAVERLEERETIAAYARVIAEWNQEAVEQSLNEHASTHAGRNPASKQEEHDMAELKTMRAAYARIDDQLDEMEKLMPKEDLEAFRKARRQVEVVTREVLGQQEKVERLRGGFEGQNRQHVRPVAMFELGNFDLEQQHEGEVIRYRHRTDTGTPGHIAFVDQGAKVEVHDWTNREAVLAALQLASDKWGAINVTGSRRYKTMVVELAAEHGISVANPELQGRLEAARERVALKAEKAPGFTEAPTAGVKTRTSTQANQSVTQSGLQGQALTDTDNGRSAVLEETDPRFAALKPVEQHIERDWRLAHQLGVVSEIEAHAANRLTAAQTAVALGDKLQRVDEISAANNEQVFARQNREQLVRSVRNKLGIPSMDEKTAFEAWVSNVQSVSALKPVDDKSDNEPARSEKLVVNDPYNEQAVLASLVEANRKWGAVQLESKDEQFLVVAVKVAAENNIPVRNAELQELYRMEQERVEYEAHARPGLVNPVAREEEGRDAWNKVMVAAIQLAEAKETEQADDARARYQSQLRAAARLAMYGNPWLTELAKAENALASELMVVEAEEELRQSDEAEKRSQTETDTDAQREISGKDPADRMRNAPAQQFDGEDMSGLRSATGILLQTGQALYRESEKESMTPYAEIRTDEGRVERLWGVTMPKAVIDAQAKNGDRVTIVLDGRKTVEKLVPVIDEKTGARTYEKREVERNVWTVTVHRPEESKDRHVSLEAQATAEWPEADTLRESQAAQKSQARQNGLDIDKAEAERFTSKSWDELNTLEVAKEIVRQREIKSGSEHHDREDDDHHHE